MEFVDLFAGLGGFHQALTRFGHTCVFACELDKDLRALYERNFGLPTHGDIRTIPIDDIPRHDILCAGFPCQPFSKAGEQKGRDCPDWGDLFDYVLKVLKRHTPRYILLENVPNLKNHDGGKTWDEMEAALTAAGYYVDVEQFSPHHFGIPQVRQRMYIVGSRFPLWNFKWPDKAPIKDLSIDHILMENPPEARRLSAQVRECLDVWQDFLDHFPKDEQLPTFPIWSMEFGATYPYKGATPHAQGIEQLRRWKGSYGESLRAVADDEMMHALPPYARGDEAQFPDWKVEFIRQNRDLYTRHRTWIEPWMPRIRVFPSSLQKLEWNCKGDTERNIKDHIIQFRASGVRIKRKTAAPSLVAMTTTQVPIIAWEDRYMTPRECARLQSMDDNILLPATPTTAFKALGNAVNVDLVARVADALLTSGELVAGLAARATQPEVTPALVAV